MLRAVQEWLLSCWPFDLLPLNEVYRLMLSITLYSLRYFDNFWQVYIYICIPKKQTIQSIIRVKNN